MIKLILKILLRLIVGFVILFGVVGTIAVGAYINKYYSDLCMLGVIAFVVVSSSYLVGKLVVK